MRHAGKARWAAVKLIVIGLIIMLAVLLSGVLAVAVGTAILAFYSVIVALWVIYTVFTLYFFRDPTPLVPAGANLVVSPAHGKVDILDTVAEPEFMGGQCRRISIFLSVFNVHVQNAAVGGKIAFYKYTQGQFLSALRTESAVHNENALFGIESVEPKDAKVGVRLIAGVLARRIVPWVKTGDAVARGDRISLIQFGSRVDVYLPVSVKITVRLGDRVVGGETVIAEFE